MWPDCTRSGSGAVNLTISCDPRHVSRANDRHACYVFSVREALSLASRYGKKLVTRVKPPAKENHSTRAKGVLGRQRTRHGLASCKQRARIDDGSAWWRGGEEGKAGTGLQERKGRREIVATRLVMHLALGMAIAGLLLRAVPVSKDKYNYRLLPRCCEAGNRLERSHSSVRIDIAPVTAAGEMLQRPGGCWLVTVGPPNLATSVQRFICSLIRRWRGSTDCWSITMYAYELSKIIGMTRGSWARQ